MARWERRIRSYSISKRQTNMGKYRIPDDEVAEFRNAVRDAQPLIHDKVEPHRRKPKPRPAAERIAGGLSADDLYPFMPAYFEQETTEVLEFSRPGVQKRLLRELRRGRIAARSELDLHGLSVSAAQGALVDFLNRCLARGERSVRIIHGKGYGSSDRQPILKQQVNLWLRQIPSVSAFCSARRREGGTGALYVLLARKHGAPRRQPRPG